MASSWRTKLLWILVVTAVFTLIIAGFYAEENARGARAWEQCQRDAAARGQSLDWSHFVPAPIPDSQNFYQAPMMTEWFTRNGFSGSTSASAPVGYNADTDSEDITEVTASNYLAWCSTFDTNFDLIRTALKRPGARINGDYTNPFALTNIPNFVNYRAVAKVLVHRAKCHLVLGESSQALDDLTLLYQFNQTLTTSNQSRFLVTVMINSAIVSIYTSAIASGIDSHAWKETELATLQKQLAGVDLLPIFKTSMEGEQATDCRIMDRLFTYSGKQPLGIPGLNNSLFWLLPIGWLQQNKVTVVNAEQKILDCFDTTNRLVTVYKAKAANLWVDNAFSHRNPYNLVASIMVPNFTKALEVTARNQTWVDQALLACALERYRLAHGQYPPALATLVPQYLAKIPNDIISGKPMIYVRQDNQHFLLYSVGWNEADDGGTIAHDAKGSEDREHGDWVWHYPAN